jgi:hypothetical protein
MNAQQLLQDLNGCMEYFYEEVALQDPLPTPRQIGAFGKTLTDCLTQAVIVNGERFLICVEKDPSQ